MLKPILLLAAVISVGVAVPPAVQKPANAAGDSATGFAQLPTDAQAKAKSIYKIDCALCHGDDGNGQSEVAESMKLTMENWTDGKVLAGKADKDLFDMIRKGKDPMPPEPTDRATDAQVHNLVLYIRSLAKAVPDAVPAAPAAATKN